MKRQLLLLLVLLLGSPANAEEPRYAGKPLAFWIDELKHDDPLIREEALLVLTEAGPAARAVTPQLEALLKDQPRNVRVRAALALWRIAGQTKPAVAALSEALRDPAAGNRADMLIQLAQLGSAAASAAPVVLPLLDDADTRVRFLAGSAMRNFGSAAVPSILPLLDDRDARVRRSACRALAPLGPSAREAVPKLTALLADADTEVRQDALLALGQAGEAARAAVPALLKLTHDKNPRLRAASLSALQQVGADASVARPAAREALENDDDPLVRVRAAGLLWHVAPKHPDILPHVLELLKQPVGRGELVDLLGQMGPAAARAVPLLSKLLANAETDMTLRRKTIQTMGRIGPAARPAAVAVAEQLRSPDFNVRNDVVNALRSIRGDSEHLVPVLLKLGEQDLSTRSMILPLLADYGSKAAAAVPSLVEDLHRRPSYVTVQAAETLFKIDPESARKEAAPVLQKMIAPAGSWRVYAALALRRIDPDNEEALRALIDVATSGDVNARPQAYQFLGQLGKSARAAAPALRKGLKDAAIGNRVNAAFALWKVSGETDAALPVLLEALKASPGNYWRAQTANMLGEMGPAIQAAALPELRKYREDADFYVRDSVRRAIERIEGSGSPPQAP